MKSFLYFIALSFCFLHLNAHDPAFLTKKLDDEKAKYAEIAATIWKWAEPGYSENKTTALLQENLKKEGFKIETGIADIPTAFVATYGSGKPIIGILAEMDALPGLSQQPTPNRNVLVIIFLELALWLLQLRLRTGCQIIKSKEQLGYMEHQQKKERVVEKHI